jgi:large subunit ribosomal protein L1
MAKKTQKKKVKDLTEYTFEEALKKVRNNSKTKFDPTVEVHIALNTDPSKQEHQIRFPLSLPHGTGKEVKVAVFASKKVKNADIELGEGDLTKIEKGDLKPKVDFDVIVAEPRFMPKLAKVAKVLGPQGMMPNPKTGTVTEDVEAAVGQIKKGKVEIRTEKSAPVIHTIIGKLSFEDEKLEENFKTIVDSVRHNKPAKLKSDFFRNISLCATMSPSFRVSHSG